MKNIKFIFLLIIALFFTGCSSSEYILKNNTNLNGYRYVYVNPIKDSDGSNDKFGLREKVINLFLAKGFRVQSKNEAKNLSDELLGQALNCVISYNYNNMFKATAYIKLYNYKNDLIYSGRGTESLGWSLRANIIGAVENAFENFNNLYSGFNPKYAINPIKEFNKKFINWEKINYDEQSFKMYLENNIDKLDRIEGIWTSIENNQYRIGIIKDKKNKNRDFVAFILKSDNPFWKPKQVKIEFLNTAYKDVYSTTYYMSDHSKQGLTTNINNNGILEITLRNSKDGTDFNANFIKNYPSNISSAPNINIDKEHKNSEGSGFLISKSGLVVTNWHVVKGANGIKVIIPKIKKSFSAIVSLKDTKNDIAILKLKSFNYSKIYISNIPYLIHSTKKLKQGQKVFTIGYPLGNILGKTAKLSDGIINSLYGINDDPRLLQISNPIQPGNSGGPLFNKEGELIGIVVSTLNAKLFYDKLDILPQNVNFAIKSDYLLNLISMLPEENEIKNNTNLLSKYNLVKQVEKINPFIVKIETK